MSEAPSDQDFSATIIELMGARNARATPKADAKDEIRRLSELDESDVEYLTGVRDAAKRLGLPQGQFRKLVEAERKRRKQAEAAQAEPQVEEPPPAEGEPPRFPRGFKMGQERGLFAQPSEQAEPIWVCAPFEVLGEARNVQNEGWSKWLRWRDPDGHPHEMPVDADLVYKTNSDLEARLAYRGLRISADPRARGLLRQALGGVRSGSRAMLVSHPGWAVLKDGSRGYMFPNGDTIGDPGETLILHPVPENGRSLSAVAGDLEAWKQRVAALAVGNAPVVFCIAAAFTGPLLDIVGEVSGGFHFVGGSKTGKSLMARFGVSVWGLPFEEGAFRSWNTTVNAMETTAEASNDGLLMLDEIHQVASPDKVVKAIYLLANGGGKDRMTKDATGKPRRSWQTFVLSTGEKDVAEMAAQANEKVPAGADVRMPCIRTDETNTWQELHGHGNLEKLAEAGCATMRQQHGTAGRTFVERLTKLDEAGRKDLRTELATMREWMFSQLSADACAQVRDVARRFALVAFAGELATKWGLLPWEEGSAKVAARSMMRRWLEERGDGKGTSEERDMLETLRAFLLTAGQARFVPILPPNADGEAWAAELDFIRRPPPNRAGWRRRVFDRDPNSPEDFLIEPAVWEAECRKLKLPSRATLKLLKAKGFLAKGDGRHLAGQHTLPGAGRIRAYCILGSFLESQEGGDEEGALPF